MSHISKIELEILDLDALKAAVKRLHPDLEFKADQKTFHWYGRFVGDSPVPEGMNEADYGKCLHAIGFRAGSKINVHGREVDGNMAYELGVVKLPGQKGFTLVYDAWHAGKGLETAIGRNAETLKQAYSREVTLRTMRRQGYRVTETTETDGTIRLVCSKQGKG